MEQLSVNLNQLSIKARTKNEMYRILTTEANLYLPPQKETSIYFVRDIIHGRKKVRTINMSIFNLESVSWWSKAKICTSNQRT